MQEKIIDHFNKSVYKYLEGNYWIAGGAVLKKYLDHNSYSKSDIDLYFPNLEQHNLFLKNKLFLNNSYVLRETNNSKQIHIENIQMPELRLHDLQEFQIPSNKINKFANNLIIDCIKIFFNSPQDTINNFDLNVCQCAVDRENFYSTQEFEDGIKTKKLKVNYSIDVPLTIFRLDKYINLGFKFSIEDFCELIDYLCNFTNSKIDSPEDFFHLFKRLNSNLKQSFNTPSSFHTICEDFYFSSHTFKLISEYFNIRSFDHIKTFENYLIDHEDNYFVVDCLQKIPDLNKERIFAKKISSLLKQKIKTHKLCYVFSTNFPELNIKKYLSLI